jgi:DNA-binding XRE family transcriptional regulator
MGFNLDDVARDEPEFSQEVNDYINQRRRELKPQIALVKQLRTALGLSQVEVANILRVTQSNVSKIENKNDPSLSTLAQIVGAKGGKLTLDIETAEGVEIRLEVAG